LPGEKQLCNILRAWASMVNELLPILNIALPNFYDQTSPND
jgi:hypothetical protein